MNEKRFSWKTEKLQHSDDEVIMVVDNANKEWKGHILNIVDKLNELNIRQNSLIEVSGGITEDTIVDYAKLGVDIISIGALTHSSRSLNFSMKF